ncbi:bifunctional demethylmenaquinone methyltransferase/2-methoxy-6-polyprenyl-1,4-benzoquinol methylase UbiE [Candidiatus Paracoxiella cheracis]|uniref:bifunctional demethylmenaquinone methyltransferase/2-methoxy-6-polyprenyl-1,4-benzoquinol methylase UbiE n=1 Tax=Candidiatus Paracoxiella cheracis TaxID=3405120 RepID=UPI003BF4D39E
MTDSSDKFTDFGYQRVPLQEKTQKVASVFTSVANKYDLMNDFMSLGIHRAWKQFAVNFCHIRPGQRILDLAGGTGDLAARMSPMVGDTGKIILADINNAMLQTGRDRLIDRGIVRNVEFIQANAEALPFDDNYFDRIIIGFGLRNVTDKNQALASMCRVLKPGGCAIVLEFSHPTLPALKTIYDRYSFNILPWLGKRVANDEESYRYLAESIRMHPDQDTLKHMMENAGFEDCDYRNLTGGIVALHKGYKY